MIAIKGFAAKAVVPILANITSDNTNDKIFFIIYISFLNTFVYLAALNSIISIMIMTMEIIKCENAILTALLKRKFTK